MTRIITLLTDFGWEDPYVAVMKGVILSECRDVQLVDACHHVDAQQVRQAAWVLAGYWKYFPAQTIHVVVIDPGVGTSRSALVVHADDHWMVAPDNGVLDLVVKSATSLEAFRIDAAWHRPGTLSSTFHGRDVFAYAAGRMAAGDEVETFADRVPLSTRLSWPKPVLQDHTISGEVIAVDRFGNLITNIPAQMLTDPHAKIIVGSHVIERVSKTYAEGEDEQFMALLASHDFLEIAVKNGSAAHLVSGVVVGMPVRVAGLGRV